MSTIKVDTIATRTGSGNITLSNNVASLTSAGAISGTNLSASGTLAVTGNTTMGGTAAITGNTTVGGTLTSTGKITSTAGITFGSDTAAANVLDDYEEGTWTPAVTVGTVSTANGHYKKIGGVVHFRAYMTNFANTSNNETMYVTGLPFTIANASAVGNAMWENINNDFKFDIVYVNVNSQILFYFSASGAYAELRHTHLDGSNSGVHLHGTYLTDQ